MKMTNNDIYMHAQQLAEAFQDGEQRFPIKLSFYLQKNKNTLLELARGIDEARIEIAKAYGELDETGENYHISPDKIEQAGQELQDLYNLEQDVTIYKVNMDIIPEDIMITSAQMEALMFMLDIGQD